MALETAAILKLLELAMDGASALAVLAQKNQRTFGMLHKAVEEGRLPTDEEHQEIRKSMEDSLNDLKETYRNM